MDESYYLPVSYRNVNPPLHSFLLPIKLNRVLAITQAQGQSENHSKEPNKARP